MAEVRERERERERRVEAEATGELCPAVDQFDHTKVTASNYIVDHREQKAEAE
jgi:hypothetical protein